MLVITILDHDLERMNTCEIAVKQAVKEVGLDASVIKMSEPPYLSRLNVWERLPALEIEGKIWSKKVGKAYTNSEVVKLLITLFKDRESSSNPH